MIPSPGSHGSNQPLQPDIHESWRKRPPLTVHQGHASPPPNHPHLPLARYARDIRHLAIIADDQIAGHQFARDSQRQFERDRREVAHYDQRLAAERPREGVVGRMLRLKQLDCVTRWPGAARSR
jgi:hypothetical protein